MRLATAFLILSMGVGVAAAREGSPARSAQLAGSRGVPNNLVTADGTSTLGNTVVLKFDSAGRALWTQAVGNATEYSQFLGLAISASGIYACGIGMANAVIVKY